MAGRISFLLSFSYCSSSPSSPVSSSLAFSFRSFLLLSWGWEHMFNGTFLAGFQPLISSIFRLLFPSISKTPKHVTKFLVNLHLIKWNLIPTLSLATFGFCIFRGHLGFLSELDKHQLYDHSL